MRLRSAVCPTEVVVVRASAADDVPLQCGGAPMVPLDSTVGPDGPDHPDPAFASGTQLGKRYGLGSDLELLCTKAGDGALSVGATPVPLKEAKPLPSSD
jgi:hypothetical protein